MSELSEAGGTRANKRQRRHSVHDQEADPSEGRPRRQRAPTACTVCRSRKVKCSAERPTCAACARLGYECIYTESLAPIDRVSAQNHTEIVDLLHVILQKIPAQQPSLPRSLQTASSQVPNGSEVEHLFGSDSPPVPTASDAAMGFSSEFNSLHWILRWPIYRDKAAGRSQLVDVVATDHLEESFEGRTAIGQPVSSLPLLDGEEVAAFLRKFLRLVHIKLPVMDCTTLLNYGRTVVELGPMWDAKTCLVLIAVALGAIVKPFDATEETAESLARLSSRDEHVDGQKRAEAYYQYAARRFGFLDRSLTSCHCHLFSGVYLLYTLRPVQAWQSFFQASSSYTAYLTGRAASQVEGGGADQVYSELQARLEQRLYWGCLKSESESCNEMDLPTSSLIGVQYPSLFPNPPTPRTVDDMDRPEEEPTTAPTSPAIPSTLCQARAGEQDFKELHEHSWFYFLSEISLLRLSRRVNQAFYTKQPSSWATLNLLHMVESAWALEEELQRLQEHLPLPISTRDINTEPGSVTGLKLATWLRCSNIKLRLYRPFMYRLAHPQDSDFLLREPLQKLATKAVLASVDPVCAVGLRNRHAGTWHQCRDAAARILLLVCARQVGLLETMQMDWAASRMIKVYIEHLRYWESEAADIKAVRRFAESLVSEGQ